MMAPETPGALPKRAHPIRVLFIHQNFPGQFGRIALCLAKDPHYEVLSVGKEGCPTLDGVRTLTYQLHRVPSASTHQYARPLEAGILYGQACLRLLLKLKVRGYVPDVIISHPGWGETLFIREVFPSARLVHFCEFYYQVDGADVGFDPEFPISLNDRARIRAKNGLHLLNLEQCDIAVTPTRWQHSLHPSAYRAKIKVIHEGIDTQYMKPDRNATFELPNGVVLRYGDPIVTYVARNLEPYRGFHIFMRALPLVLAGNPECQVLIVGGDDVSYGAKPKGFISWREKMLSEVAISTERVHFLGKIPYSLYRKVLQVSAAHVYLTYPFVLSWSILEAMACGCLVIGSKTAPVKEVITDFHNGLLVDFFDVHTLAATVIEGLTNPGFEHLRLAARATIVERFSAEDGLSKYNELLKSEARIPV